MSQLILQPFRHFTHFTARSPTLLLLHLRHSSFSNPSVGLPTAHSPTLPSLYPCHSSFSNLSVALPTSQLSLQPFRCFTYVTAQSPTLPSLYLRHSSVYNPSVALPMSQLILQPFRSFTYITAHSPTLPLLHPRHSSFSNPCFASPTSQALHLASRPWLWIVIPGLLTQLTCLCATKVIDKLHRAVKTCRVLIPCVSDRTLINSAIYCKIPQLCVAHKKTFQTGETGINKNR